VAKENKGSNKKPRKGNNAVEIYEQIEHTKDLLVAGYRPGEIRKMVAERYGCSLRTVDTRISQARDAMVRDASQVDRHQLASQLLETYSEILRKARDSNQLNNALGACAGIARLTGLDASKN
jgi:hypothetical protein